LQDQGKKLGELGVWVDSAWQWRLSWGRNRFEWKCVQEEELFFTLANIYMNRQAKELMVWLGDGFGKYSVKLAYENLYYVIGQNSDVFKSLWKVKVMPSVLTLAGGFC